MHLSLCLFIQAGRLQPRLVCSSRSLGDVGTRRPPHRGASRSRPRCSQAAPVGLSTALCLCSVLGEFLTSSFLFTDSPFNAISSPLIISSSLQRIYYSFLIFLVFFFPINTYTSLLPIFAPYSEFPVLPVFMALIPSVILFEDIRLFFFSFFFSFFFF